MFHATTKSDSTSYTVCHETLAPLLDQLLSSSEAGPLINFMGLLARKAGDFPECMKWNDLGLRKTAKENRAAMSSFTLRNAAVMFCLKPEEVNDRKEEVEMRMGYAINCLGKLEGSEGEGVPEEVDFLRRCVLVVKKEDVECKVLKEARTTLPKRILKACLVLVDADPVPPTQHALLTA